MNLEGWDAHTRKYPSKDLRICKICHHGPYSCRKGKAQYENGGVYEGEFENDVRAGWGRHIFPKGDVYEGEWLKDEMHGEPITPNLLVELLTDIADMCIDRG